MTRHLAVFVLLLAILRPAFTQAQDTLRITPDLLLVRLSDHAWIHTSWFDSPQWGRFPSNGLVVSNGGEALLFDTPMNDWLTAQLADYLLDSLHLRLKALIPNHFHGDCTEGMDVLQCRGIPVMTLSLTDSILRSAGLPPADTVFHDSLRLSLNGFPVECRFFGAGHAPDNIVTWLPGERILFAGCMSKSAHSKSLGNTADADLAEWPRTIRRVMAAYPDPQVVVPGHGEYGDAGVLRRTLELLGQ